MKTALLIIDLQKDFFGKPALATQAERLIHTTNELARIVRENQGTVIWIRQEMKPDGSNAPLGDRKEGNIFVAEGTEGAALLDGLERLPDDYEVVKTRYSGFFNTELETLLREQNIERLVVCGINTHACVRMTVLDAYERDYEILLALDAIGSWDEEHHAITVKYFTGKITEPLTNAQIAERLATLS